MSHLTPTRLQDEYVVLEPLRLDHAPALEAAAADGELWNLWFTSVPAPGQARSYVEKALQAQSEGLMLPFAVREQTSGEIVGTTRYYDIVPELPRLAIGYTWYARRWQKSHLNTACKRLLLRHAFETIHCVAVELHTDRRNLDSQPRSSASAPIATAFCMHTSADPMARCATRSATASWPMNGPTWIAGWRCGCIASRRLRRRCCSRAKTSCR